MVPFGGVGVMLVGVVLSGAVCVGLAAALSRRFGWAWSVTAALLVWSTVCIGLLTLLPANGSPGVVAAATRSTTCSMDIGGPAPDGFWIFSGGQRLLNTLIFVPSGALLVLTFSRWRAASALVPLGLFALVGYSALIEKAQLELARIDRACDITDVIDNASGAAIGVAIGLVLTVALRPWRWGRART